MLPDLLVHSEYRVKVTLFQGESTNPSTLEQGLLRIAPFEMLPAFLVLQRGASGMQQILWTTSSLSDKRLSEHILKVSLSPAFWAQPRSSDMQQNSVEGPIHFAERRAESAFRSFNVTTSLVHS